MELAELGPSHRPLMSEGETILLVQKNVGIYKNSQRDKRRDCGVVYLTSHRVFYVDDLMPREQSVKVELSAIASREYHASELIKNGFLRTSPKISLTLMNESSTSTVNGASVRGRQVSNSGSGAGVQSQANSDQRRWKCPVCSHTNQQVQTPPKCSECGITPRRPIEELMIGGPASNDGRNTDEGLTCPMCTFLNHPSMQICEMCETKLKDDQDTKSHNASLTSISRHSSESALQSNEADELIVKLSFRGGGSSAFYTTLGDAMNARMWEKPKQNPRQQNQALTPGAGTLRGTGISNVLNQAKQERETNDQTLRDGFTDLEVLSKRATEMVALAEQLSRTMKNKNSKSSSAAKDKRAVEDDNKDESSPFTQYLVDIGLENAITKDAAGDAFYEQIAHEISQVLEDYVNRVSGEVPLVEAYCIYNRARGIAPIPPMDFVHGCKEMPRLNLGLEIWTYPNSGLKVLRATDSRSGSLQLVGGRDLASTLVQYAHGLGSISALELAVFENCSVTLAMEHLTYVESLGHLCRDESVKEVRFYENIITKVAAGTWLDHSQSAQKQKQTQASELRLY